MSAQADGWGNVAKMKGVMESSMAQNEAISNMKRDMMYQQSMMAFENDMAETSAKMVKSAGESVKGLA